MFLKHRKEFWAAQKAIESNEYLPAEEVLNRILEVDADAAEALLHRALVRLRMNKLDAALSDADQLVKIRSDNGLGHMIRGEILLEMKNYAEAYSSLQKAAQMEADNGRAFYHLARACIGLGKKFEAADYFEQALQFERDYTMAQFLAEFFEHSLKN